MLIELHDLKKTYLLGEETVHALDGVSLTIGKGEFVAIMGASGSGKSTLMQILGLLDLPTSGAYKLFGRDVSSLDEETLAQLRGTHFGFVFQQFFLLPKMTALQNVALPLLYAGDTRDKGAAEKNLELVGLTSRKNHQPNQMSGGQQQRVAIARALVNNPEIIFADEPTGNLDSRTKVEIMEQLKQLNDSGKTVVLVTHEDDMAKYAKRIITMRDGKIATDVRTDGSATPAVQKEVARPLEVKRRGIHFWDYCKQALSSIFSHKTRSLLSVLGILIGVAAVIAMLALGEGANRSLQTQLASLGSNLLMVRPGMSTMNGVALESGAGTRLSQDDAQAIAREVPGLTGVSGVVSMRAQVTGGPNNANTQIDAVERPYEKIRAVTPIAGRFFSAEEEQAGSKVALLGATVIRELFGDADPIGQTIRVNETYFNVIGVLPVRGVSGPRDQDDQIIIPLKTGMKRLMGKDYLDVIFTDVKDAADVDMAQAKIIEILSRRHRVIDEKSQPFEVRNMADIKNTLSGMTRTMSGLLGAVAAISLVVGGIGIMNIMLVAVAERTKEIGLRKAIGARARDILYQFLFESVLLSLIGGFLGISLGVGVSMLMAAILGWAVTVSMFAVVLSAGFSFMVGVVFGLWPAWKASKLSPIVALRYE